jgi:hypothetical protein
MAKKGPGRGRRGSTPRGPGGRFASTKAPASTPIAPPPPPEVKSAEAEVEKKIGILEALLEKQQKLSGGDTELSRAVLGKNGTKGVRSQIEDLVRKNRESLQDLDDPNNAANFAVIESALALSERAVRSKDRKEQVDIYNKLKFIREVAEKTTGDKSDITKKIAEIIKPVEGVLKSKTGFVAFAKERLTSKLKAAPEAIVRQIPLVGGLLGDYLQEKRAGREELEGYAGRRIESISQAGSKQNELERILQGRGGVGGIGGIGGVGKIPPFRGASTIGSMVGGAAGAGLAGLATGESSTLGQIAADVRAIKEGIIGKKSGTEALKEKEKAIKDMAGVTKADEKQKGLFGGLGKTLSGMLGGGGLLSGLAGMFGMGGGAANTGAAGGKPGILSQVTDLATNKATDWGLKKGWEGAKGLASKGWQGAKSMLGFGANAAEGAAGTAAKGAVTAAEGAAGTAAKGAVTAAEGAAGTAAKSGGSWFGRAWEGAKGLASSGLETVKSAGSAALSAGKAVVGEAAAIAKAVANPVQFLKGNVGKIMGGMKALGPITAAIEGIIGAFNIYNIKNDPNIPPEQKKEMIGAEISKRFGAAVGGVIGGGLGSAIGPIGTVLGGVAGAMGGEWVGNQIAELVGPKGIYDFVSSIPVVGDLVKVDETPYVGDGSTTPPTTGTVSPTPTAATPVGQQATAMEATRKGVEDNKAQAEKIQAASMQSAGSRTMNQQINNNSNTVVNNYNDDLRVRNSEATLKIMERSTII